MFNVQGIGTKMNVIPNVNSVNNVGSEINISTDMFNADIVILLETWLPKNSTIESMGYANIPAYNVYRSKHPRARRCSGGISFVVKDSVMRYFTVVKQNKFCMWVRVDGNALGLSKDLYIGGVYLPPSQSVYINTSKGNASSPFFKLEEDFAYFQNKGHVVALGDFNARTANEQDFHYNVQNLSPNDDTIATLPKRKSRDTGHNTFGEKLLKICNATGMIILNGRTRGDQLGNFTSFQSSGCSVVDYIICSDDIISKVDHMLVSAPTKFSDHAMLFLLLNIPIAPKPVQPKVHMSDSPTFFKWDSTSQVIFQREMESQKLKNQISKENSSQLNVDDCASTISGAIN